MAGKRRLTDDEVAKMRQCRLDGMSTSAIAAEFKVARSTAARRLAGDHKGAGHPPPLPRPRQARRVRNVSARARTALIQRLWRAAKRQVKQIEERPDARARAGSEAGEIGERDARLLAVLVRTLRELAALDQANSAAADPGAKSPAQPTDPDHDDPVPRDIDEFRRELARRIEAFVGRESDGAIPGDSG